MTPEVDLLPLNMLFTQNEEIRMGLYRNHSRFRWM